MIGALAGILVLTAALATSAFAAERPRLERFHCEIGGDRIHILLPRAAELRTDDELLCQVVVAGLPADGAELAAELRARAPDGRVLTVGSGRLDRDGTHARADELVVPHATWVSAVWWASKSAVLRLELSVLSRPLHGRRWRTLLTRALVIDHHPRRRPR